MSGTGLIEVKERFEEIWEAQPGPQTAFIACMFDEIGYGGARGGGKSDAILGKWMQHAHIFKEAARGIIFRRSYPELEELELRAIELLVACGWHYISNKRTFIHHNGARLKLRYLDKDKDAGKYQGHAYSFIAIDEYGEFPSPIPINKVKVCLRSAKGAKTIFISTFNPGGVGHNHIKQMFIDPAPPMTKMITPKGKSRIFIPAKLTDNIILTHKDPGYWDRIVESGIPPWLLKAWLHGDWDIVAGGFFDDLWDRSVHIMRPFTIPECWTITRSFDWGSSRPFSVGWWAESDGTNVLIPGHDGTVKFCPGTLFRIGEWYGWNGKPNEGLKMTNGDIALGIIERETAMGIADRVYPGPADPSIWDCSRGPSIADDMAEKGVDWTIGENKPGSRVIRWQRIRKMLKSARTGSKEEPGIYTFDNCRDGFIRCMPVTQRDIKKVEDIDTEQEDHVQDEVGYRVMGEAVTTKQTVITH